MKNILISVFFLISLAALADGPIVQTTSYTRNVLRATNSADAQLKLGFTGTNLTAVTLGVISNTALNAVNGTIINASTNAETATNAIGFQNVSYIYPTNVIANGVGDDTLALSNAIVKVNNTSQPLTVLDLLGKSYGVYSPLPPLDRFKGQLRNGEIDYYSTNGIVLQFPNTNAFSSLDGNYVISHVSILNKVTAMPNTNCVGLLLGDFSGFYGANTEVKDCFITNFWRGIQVAGMAQTYIHNNTIMCNWSNDVHIANGGTPDPDMIKIMQNDMNHAEVGGGANITNQAFNAINIQCDVGNKDLDIEQNNVGGTRAFLLAFPRNSDTISVNYKYNEIELIQNDNVHTNYCPVTVWDGDLTYINGQHGDGSAVGISSNFTADVGIYATNGFGINLQDDFIYQVQAGFTVDVWAANWLNSDYFVNSLSQLKETIHNAWQDPGTAYAYQPGQGNQPVFWANTNRILMVTSPYGQNAANEIDIFGGGGGGIQVFNNGDSVAFDTAGIVTFGGGQLFSGGIAGRGAFNSLLFDGSTSFKKEVQVTTLNSSTTDFAASNGTLFAVAPFATSILATNGFGSGATNTLTMGSTGITNTLSVNIVIYGFNTSNPYWITNAATGFKAFFGSSTPPMDHILQPGDAITGGTVGASGVRAF